MYKSVLSQLGIIQVRSVYWSLKCNRLSNVSENSKRCNMCLRAYQSSDDVIIRHIIESMREIPGYSG